MNLRFKLKGKGQNYLFEFEYITFLLSLKQPTFKIFSLVVSLSLASLIIHEKSVKMYKFTIFMEKMLQLRRTDQSISLCVHYRIPLVVKLHPVS